MLLLLRLIIWIQYQLLATDVESCAIDLFAAIACYASVCALLRHAHLLTLLAPPELLSRVLEVDTGGDSRLLNSLEPSHAVFHCVHIIVEDAVTL